MYDSYITNHWVKTRLVPGGGVGVGRAARGGLPNNPLPPPLLFIIEYIQYYDTMMTDKEQEVEENGFIYSSCLGTRQ